MLTMEMGLHKDVDFAPKFGKNQNKILCQLLWYETSTPMRCAQAPIGGFSLYKQMSMVSIVG